MRKTDIFVEKLRECVASEGKIELNGYVVTDDNVEAYIAGYRYCYHEISKRLSESRIGAKVGRKRNSKVTSEILQLIVDKRTDVKTVAEACGISRQAVYNKYNEWKSKQG